MKKRMMFITTAIAVPLASMPVLASESGTANAAVVTAMTSVSNDMLATANAIVPVALTVVGIALVVTFGIRIFKRIVGR